MRGNTGGDTLLRYTGTEGELVNKGTFLRDTWKEGDTWTRTLCWGMPRKMQILRDSWKEGWHLDRDTILQKKKALR